jgi:hypothetical protein
MPAIQADEWFNRVRVLRPNAAMMDKISLCTLGHLESGDPVELGEFMGALALDYIARNVSMPRNVGAFSRAAADARRAGDEG